ncbi:hypothetical protein FDP41_003219 [Naegleria fowleri]|uniref:Ras-related protein Rab n=1 Tax=Naegleria fowleri TaxID=5763 RepID=A0A6A5BLK2_NAEFO|nr:uncharacterized protein FDP41_003219 [Naegleria fowleri]KAF0977897.1 hypothetical protein FDP41_003219 [Naegleria fowleri]
MSKAKYMYKIIFVGDSTCGKTAFIQQYVNNYFTSSYKSTLGVDFSFKEYDYDENTCFNLQDIAGQERFGTMTSVFYRDAVVAVVMYDVTNPNTFEHTKDWKEDIDSKVFLPALHENEADDIPIPCILVGNKIDLPKNDKLNFKPSQLDEYCTKHKFAGWVEISVKEKTNMDKAVKMIVEQVLNFHQKVIQYSSDNKDEKADSGIINIDKLVKDMPKTDDGLNGDSKKKGSQNSTSCCGGK